VLRERARKKKDRRDGGGLFRENPGARGFIAGSFGELGVVEDEAPEDVFDTFGELAPADLMDGDPLDAFRIAEAPLDEAGGVVKHLLAPLLVVDVNGSTACHEIPRNVGEIIGGGRASGEWRWGVKMDGKEFAVMNRGRRGFAGRGERCVPRGDMSRI
jgi:hypothetical protein